MPLDSTSYHREPLPPACSPKSTAPLDDHAEPSAAAQRPGRRTGTELLEAVQDMLARPTVRCVLLQAAGKSFVLAATSATAWTRTCVCVTGVSDAQSRRRR